jgi:hypothetical protein
MNFEDTINNLKNQSGDFRKIIFEFSKIIVDCLINNDFISFAEHLTNELKYSLLDGTKEQAKAKLEFIKKAIEEKKRVVISEQRKKELEYKSEFGLSMNDVTDEMVAIALSKYFVNEPFKFKSGVVKAFIPYSVEIIGKNKQITQKTANSTIFLINDQQKKITYMIYWILDANLWKISGITKKRFLIFNYWTIGTDYMPSGD